jgi:hypothetical protein
MGKSLFPFFVHTFASDPWPSVTALRARRLLDDRGTRARRTASQRVDFHSLFLVAHMRKPFDMQPMLA